MTEKRIVYTKHYVVQLLSLVFVLFTHACAPKPSNNVDASGRLVGNISISGAFALYPIAILWSEDFKALHPDVRFNISAGGAGKGITDVLTNMVDIGLVSRDLHQQEIDKGAYPIHVAKDAVIGTINSTHPNFELIAARGLTQQELVDIFVTRKYKNWNEIDSRFVAQPIEVYTRSDAAGAAETWAKFLGVNQEDLKGIGIFGDPGIAQAIKDRPLSIGFNNINYLFDLKTKLPSSGLAVIPIDINHDGKIDTEEDFYSTLPELTAAVAANRYPSPPARDLTFVIQQEHRDNALLKAFIQFVLEKEQQGYLLENGYVPLNEEAIAVENKKLLTR
ncbi:PstS family phosphate ABC transporter substrate-binding protein [Sphingobacterium sp. lm-10]|uniref:PstS family phosphate ABC transporter substrate-binding protein n=1 Tax=Sphingobacterium sp. lm-10 TaxID=2944904 RepID=UPI00201FCEBE|nr:PstS family phosphate ABC transporter substrate-binding protein [Sphingobacterium sp. lm-10]MCL7986916.1 PstS family phosphate ABC transporter substrate-binding protein [Sphingobacterium sp. lm-10]